MEKQGKEIPIEKQANSEQLPPPYTELPSDSNNQYLPSSSPNNNPNTSTPTAPYNQAQPNLYPNACARISTGFGCQTRRNLILGDNIRLDCGFGSIVLDLTDSRFLLEQCIMTIQCGFGRVTIIAPDEMLIRNDIKVGFGRFEDQRRSSQNYVGPRLVIQGNVGFGSVIITSK